jgi:AAA domain
VPNTVTSSGNCQETHLDPIPGILLFQSVNFFSGASGAGKTKFSAEFVARMDTGRTIFGKATNRPPGGFYYLAADRDWRTYQQAFDAAGYPQIPHYTLAEDDSEDPVFWQPKTAFDLFRRCLDKLNPAPQSLVFIDPISPLFVKGDPNRESPVATSMHFYRRQARKRQITLMCCAGTAKPRVEEIYRRKRDQVSGSAAFVTYADTHLYINGDTDNPKEPRTVGWAPRLGAQEDWPYIFDPKTQLFVPYQEAGVTPDDRLTRLVALLPADGTALSRDDWFEQVADALKISLATFKRDLHELLEQERIEKDSWGHYKRRKSTTA